jgi:hypothetical protein
MGGKPQNVTLHSVKGTGLLEGIITRSSKLTKEGTQQQQNEM